MVILLARQNTCFIFGGWIHTDFQNTFATCGAGYFLTDFRKIDGTLRGWTHSDRCSGNLAAGYILTGVRIHTVFILGGCIHSDRHLE
jgi:hypothetical protein